MNLSYNRIKTQEVKVGNFIIGGNAPIRIQTMTNTPTSDVVSTINQTIRLYELGSEIVRIAVPTIKEVEAIKNIASYLQKNRLNIPIIADVHFNPEIAEKVAPFVQKVRINPGNYVNRSKSSQRKEFTLSEIEKEKEETYKNLVPLLKICKQHSTAIRIGINFASLSWRMINMYGNTPQAMVASAMEFYDICKSENFENLIFSFKASDVKQTIYANRLYVNEMLEKYGVVYPLHVGITEAGIDLDGRIKSIVGIGTLLLDGIGDTIRVSLTENPENEIPVAKKIVEMLNFNINSYANNVASTSFSKDNSKLTINTDKIDKNFNYTFVLSSTDESLLFNKDASIINLSLKDSLFENRKKIILSLHKEKPVIVKFTLKDSADYEFFSFQLGNLLLEQTIDGVVIETNESLKDYWENILKIILQVTGVKRTGNEYISCPSCSRTMFDIETTTRQVKEATKNLTGYKIAVMGCVVNGPGEMHDADYGMVGAGKNKVNLYKGGNLVFSGISLDEAVQALLNLIKTDEDNNSRNR